MRIPVETEYDTSYYNAPQAIKFVESLPVAEFKSFNGINEYTIERHYIELNSIEELSELMLKCPVELTLQQRKYIEEPLIIGVTNRYRSI
jgi:hypothetical protein